VPSPPRAGASASSSSSSTTARPLAAAAANTCVGRWGDNNGSYYDPCDTHVNHEAVGRCFFVPFIFLTKLFNHKIRIFYLFRRRTLAPPSVQRCKDLRIVTVGIEGGRSLTRPFRDARRFPSTRVKARTGGYLYAANVWDLSNRSRTIFCHPVPNRVAFRFAIVLHRCMSGAPRAARFPTRRSAR
jgi:hypothetical protein